MSYLLVCKFAANGNSEAIQRSATVCASRVPMNPTAARRALNKSKHLFVLRTGGDSIISRFQLLMSLAWRLLNVYSARQILLRKSPHARSFMLSRRFVLRETLLT